MIVHSFIPQVAKDYGVEKAVLLFYFAMWIEKNAAESRHFHEGRYWTCASQKAMSILFPYMSEDKIQRHISGLQRDGILIKGSFNDNPTDRTAWYAFSDKFLTYLQGIPQNYGIHSAELRSPFREIAESEMLKNPAQNGLCAIPRDCGMHSADSRDAIDTSNKRDICNNTLSMEKENSTKEKGRKPKFVPDLSFIEDPERRALFQQWVNFRAELKKPYETETGVKRGYASLCRMANDSLDLMRQVVDQSMANEWQGLFPLKTQGNGRNNQQDCSSVLIPLAGVQGGSSTL